MTGKQKFLFHTQNARMLLPQTVDAYCDFDDHRTIAYHTFTDFMLFSVHTDQAIEDTDRACPCW